MDDFESYYDLLEVSKTATPDEIKKAFHKLANQYHPDKNSNATDGVRRLAETKFKEINEAHNVLKDATKRRQYDAKLKEFEEKSQPKKSPPPSQGANKKTTPPPVTKNKITGGKIFGILVLILFLVGVFSGGSNNASDNSTTHTDTTPAVADSVSKSDTPGTLTKTQPDTVSTPVVTPKTDDQICQDSYGFGGYSTGVTNANGGLTCDCKSGYIWNSTNTSCVVKPLYTDISIGSDTKTQDNKDFSFTWSTTGQRIDDYSTWGYNYYNKTTAGNFAVVNVSINNNALNNSFVSVQNFSFVDQAGRSYYPLEGVFCDETTPSSLNSQYLLLLKPDIPCVSKLLFEVSKDSTSSHINFQYK